MPLPTSLPVGRAGAVLCLGACFHPREPIRALRLLVDGRERRPAAWRMPRADLLHALPRELGNSYRSGFWAVVPIEARERLGTVRIEVAARLASGALEVAPFGALEVVDGMPPTADLHADGGRIAVCMATFEPDMDLFKAQ